MSKLYIVGIGPGSIDYLTAAALNAMEKSDVLFGSKRALALFKKDAIKVEINTKNMQKSLEDVVMEVKHGKNVSLLSTGDPGFSGLLKPVLNLKSDIEIEVIPGISSIQLCSAKLKIPWDEADLVTMHGKGFNDEILDIIDNGKPTIILPDFKPAELAQFLIENGIDENRKAAVCQKLSYEDENIFFMSLKEILKMEFSYMSIVVIF